MSIFPNSVCLTDILHGWPDRHDPGPTQLQPHPSLDVTRRLSVHVLQDHLFVAVTAKCCLVLATDYGEGVENVGGNVSTQAVGMEVQRIKPGS